MSDQIARPKPTIYCTEDGQGTVLRVDATEAYIYMDAIEDRLRVMEAALRGVCGLANVIPERMMQWAQVELQRAKQAELKRRGTNEGQITAPPHET